MESSAFNLPTPATLARVRAEAERELSREELEAALAAPLSKEELGDRRALIAWFKRRYPTPAARLAWARRSYTRWMRK